MVPIGMTSRISYQPFCLPLVVGICSPARHTTDVCCIYKRRLLYIQTMPACLRTVIT